MNIEFLGIIILSIVLAVVLAAYERLQRKFQAIKSNQEEMESKTKEKMVKMMEEARDKALTIISEAKLSATDNEGEFKTRLSEVEEKQVNVYKNMLQTVSHKIEDEAVVEIEDFKKEIEKEAVDIQQSVKQKIEEGYKNVELDLETYKRKQMEELDNKAEEVLKDFLSIIGRKSFTFEEQKALINQALEEARKNNAF